MPGQWAGRDSDRDRPRPDPVLYRLAAALAVVLVAVGGAGVLVCLTVAAYRQDPLAGWLVGSACLVVVGFACSAAADLLEPGGERGDDGAV